MPIDTSPTTGGRAAKFDSLGDTISGVIVSADSRPQTDIETGETVTWADGTPRMQWVIVLATDLRDPAIPDDDGNRTLYAKGGKFSAATGEGTSMMEAIRAAAHAAGAKTLEEGGTLTVKHSGLGEKKNKAYSAPKLYKARYEAPAKGALDVSADNW